MEKIKELISLFKKYGAKCSYFIHDERIDEYNICYKLFVIDEWDVNSWKTGVLYSFVICIFYKSEDIHEYL